jgi:hypothetical protein
MGKKEKKERKRKLIQIFLLKPKLSSFGMVKRSKRTEDLAGVFLIHLLRFFLPLLS